MPTSRIPVSSPKLLEFYVEWLMAVHEAPRKAMPRYDASGVTVAGAGLCHSPIWAQVFSASMSDYRKSEGCHNELTDQFKAAGLDPVAPFNNGSIRDYLNEAAEGECHLNDERIAWVRSRIKDFINKPSRYTRSAK